jgi:hypothetical protein
MGYGAVLSTEEEIEHNPPTHLQEEPPPLEGIAVLEEITFIQNEEEANRPPFYETGTLFQCIFIR